MTLQDTKEFNKAFNGLAKLYNLTEYEDQRLRYFQVLFDLEIESLVTAFTEAAKRAGVDPYRFFPMPGTLRELASNVYRTSAAPFCDKCGGTGMMSAEPDRQQVERMYGDVTAQPTKTRCECRATA